MNIITDFTSYLLNKENISQYESAIADLDMKINAILDKQGEIVDFSTVNQLSDLYNELELQTNNKESVSAAQDILARNINEAIDVNFLGKSITVEVEINSEKDVFVIHSSRIDDELYYELSE